MSDVENISPAAAMQAFDKVIEDRLASSPKPATPDIAPEFAALFKHLVAVALDAFPAMTPMEVCEAFMRLAADGLDHPVVERPINIKINSKFEVLLPRSDRQIPIRPPTVEEPDMPLGVRW